MKTCTQCNQTKELSDFYIVNKRDDKIYYQNVCKTCNNQNRLEYQRNYRNNHKAELLNKRRDYYATRMNNIEIREQVNDTQRNRYPRYTAKRLLRNAQIRALKLGLQCTITLDDIQIPEYCPLLNIKLTTGTKEDYTSSPSLDRIDNSLGYTPSNIRVISSLANTMKSNATREQLLTFAANITRYLQTEDIVRPTENSNL